MDFLDVTYRIEAPPNDASALAESALLEQTVETPLTVALRDPFVREEMLGSIRSFTDDGPGRYLVTFGLPIHTARQSTAQFLNVLFGNISLHEAVTLVDFTLPPALRDNFQGPRFGIEGLRERLGVQGRPLTCTALKPVGLKLEALVDLCTTFAEGGVDLIKDDHYLGDQPFSRFEERVTACQAAVDRVSQRLGRRVGYVPNLIGTPDEVLRRAAYAQEAGVAAVLVCPFLLGLPLFHHLTSRHLEVPVLAHPSFGGTGRIVPETLFGKLIRLLGADAVIFANYGGRFSYAPETCARIAATLRQPWHDVRPAFPVPAGGMKVERTAELVEFFGRDSMLLIGGSLLEAGPDLLERTRAFTSSVARSAEAFDV